MKIKDIFQGCTPGRIQTVGAMTMIPIISDAQDERFISPTKAKFGNSNYGNMTFTNQTDKTLIVPMNVGYVTKRAAQDHAMTQAGIVKAKNRKEFNDACCIQESQGGTIPTDIYDFLILPFSLREPAHSKRKQSNYGKLWNDISRFNISLGLNRNGHVEYFLKGFEKELDEFVAEFEIVPKQVGAIILINGTLFGIEKSPSHSYFASIFKPLIRECYGSASIEFSKGIAYTKGKEYNVRVPVSSRARTIAGIRKALKDANEKQDELVKTIVRELLPEELDVKSNDSKSDGFQVSTYDNKQLVGQVITEEDNVIYASLVAKRKWLANQEWIKTRKFEI